MKLTASCRRPSDEGPPGRLGIYIEAQTTQSVYRVRADNHVGDRPTTYVLRREHVPRETPCRRLGCVLRLWLKFRNHNLRARGQAVADGIAERHPNREPSEVVAVYSALLEHATVVGDAHPTKIPFIGRNVRRHRTPWLTRGHSNPQADKS